ncbi:retrovirus-related pol polyprotein from transposon TNT 1-94 [Tanacetum coccineum]
MDLCGPMRVASVNRKKYILIIEDDYSRFTWVKFLASNDEAPDFIIKFLKMIQVRLNETVRNIRTDNGTEFANQTLQDYYEQVGISHETSVARTPQQNGVVERRNRTLVKAARTIKIIETIHVDFDELAAMASEQLGSGPGLQCMTPATPSLGLVPNPPPSALFVPPSRHEWDLVFQPVFDEFFSPPASVASPVPVEEALTPVELTGSPSSTIIDQDAPSPSTSQTTPQSQSQTIPLSAEEDSHDLEVSHMSNDSYFGISIPETVSEESSLSDVIPTTEHSDAPISEHLIILAPKVKNNREAHEYYLKHTIEQADILREVVEQSKSQNPLDSASYSACMYIKLIQELLGVKPSTSASRSKPSSSTKNDRISRKPSSNEKNKHPVKGDRALCSVCNECLFDANHAMCLIDHVVQIVLWYLDSGCSKHMTGDRSQLTNFVYKFLGTVKFSNDQVAKIMRYGDYQIVNVIISKVYYVEGLGHNLFSVGQFYDSDIEVAFRNHTCFVRILEGVDLLSGSQGTNLYSLSIRDMMASSPICLLSKATKTKSWLWHRRLSYLNFGALNHLARNGQVRGLPRLKFEKDHLCSACAMGRSKRQSHKPKSEDTN